MGQTRRPVIVVASAAGSLADQVAVRLRRGGAVVYATHSANGCLRVATSIGPDLVVLDPALDRGRLPRLLRAHPVSARAVVRQLSGDDVRPAGRMPEMPQRAAA